MSDRISAMPVTGSGSKSKLSFDEENLNISFNGCGFLGVYHVGVACGLKHYMPNMRIKNICGASAGAMAAVCLIAGVPSGKHHFINITHRGRGFRKLRLQRLYLGKGGLVNNGQERLV